MKIEIKKLPKSEVEITVTVNADTFASYHDKGFKEVQSMAEVAGFRKGNAPEDMIVKKYGEMIILEEMANLALRDAYMKAIAEHKINPIADPKITITKIAKGNPLELTITVAVMPEIELPDYKKVAKEAHGADEKIEVTDEEIATVLKELQKGRTTQHAHEHEHDENCDHSQDEAKNELKAEEKELPALDDEFAQSFGEHFKTLDDLKTKVSTNLKLEKEQKAKEKRRTAIMEKLIAETKADLPEILVDSEIERMLIQMKHDINRFGGTWEEYLKHSKKTEDEIKADWRGDAVKRATSQLILSKISLAEKLIPTPEEIEVELVRLLATVQNADEERAKDYIYQALMNEKVLTFLEKA